MPDFLSRLVERTFGLIPVAQPVTGSVFAPMQAIESECIQGLAHDSEPVSKQDNIHIESDRETGIIPQHDGQPAINQQREINKIPDNQPVPAQYVESNSQDNDYAKLLHQMDDPDNQSAFTSAQRWEQKEPIRQNGSNFLEQVESVPLNEGSEQDNRYPHTPPAKQALDNRPLYQTDSDTSESVKSEPQYKKNRNDRGILPPISKPLLQEKQFHDVKPDSTGSNFLEQVESVPLNEGNEQDNRYSYTPPPKLALDDRPLHQTDSDTSESVKSEPQYKKNRNDRGILPPISKPLRKEGQFHDAIPDSTGLDDPGQKEFVNIRGNGNTIMPVLKAGYNIEQLQRPRISSVEQKESKQSHPAGVQKKRNINRNVFTSEPEFQEDSSGSKHTGSKKLNSKHSGKNPSGQNEQLIDIADNSLNETLLGHISDSSKLHEILSNLQNGEPAFGADSYQPDYVHPSSIIASKQNPKRVNNPKAKTTLEQMGNMLIDKHAVVPKPPSTLPIVKVTIGCIEVKAVTPPQTPQPQSPPPRQRPVLSLDDYLKQYNG